MGVRGDCSVYSGFTSSAEGDEGGGRLQSDNNIEQDMKC